MSYCPSWAPSVQGMIWLWGVWWWSTPKPLCLLIFLKVSIVVFALFLVYPLHIRLPFIHWMWFLDGLFSMYVFCYITYSLFHPQLSGANRMTKSKSLRLLKMGVKLGLLARMPKSLVVGTLDQLLGLKLLVFSPRMEHDVRNDSLQLLVEYSLFCFKI